MSIPELEKQLGLAEEQLQKLLRSGGRFPDVLSEAFATVTAAQRRLAAAKGEEYASAHEIGFKPQPGVPDPVVLQNDQRTILTFKAVKPGVNGQYQHAGYAIVEFDLCMVSKFGYPNDEALEGHPLYGKGLELYGIHEVQNSTWIERITEQNRVAFPDTPDSTDKHFIFCFHDSTFECIARGLRAKLSDRPYEEIFEDIRKRVFGR